MIKWISLMLGALLFENYSLVKPLGADSFLGKGRDIKTATGMGICVIITVTLSTALSRLVYALILKPLNMEFLDIFVAIVFIAVIVQVLEIVMQNKFKSIYNSLGVYLPLTIVNSAILIIAVKAESMKSLYITSVLYAFFSGVGFLLAIVMLSLVMERCEYADVPKAFRGVPEALIGAGLLSLIFMGFQGFSIN